MKKILIVEDDRVLRNEVRTLLEGSGYETAVLEQFDRVPEEAEELKPDLILLDIILPGANGQAILRELREKSDVPVIMLTSRDGEMIISQSPIIRRFCSFGSSRCFAVHPVSPKRKN